MNIERQGLQIKLEQGAIFDGERVIYLGGRQTEWHVMGPKTAASANQ